MITAGFLYLIGGIISILTSPILLLSNVSQDSNMGSVIATISGYASPFNVVIPIDTLVSILGIVVTFEFYYFTFKCIYWIIKRIPTQS
jgi:hypothetical protein